MANHQGLSLRDDNKNQNFEYSRRPDEIWDDNTLKRREMDGKWVDPRFREPETQAYYPSGFPLKNKNMRIESSGGNIAAEKWEEEKLAGRSFTLNNNNFRIDSPGRSLEYDTGAGRRGQRWEKERREEWGEKENFMNGRWNREGEKSRYF